MSPRDLRDLIDDEDLPEGERARLERVHALLTAVDPPPELPPTLAQPPRHDPVEAGADVIPFLPRRRRGFSLGLAAAIAVLAFFGGTLWNQHREGFTATRTVEMHGVNGVAALASIQIGEEDEGSNWPMLMRVRGLQPLPKSQYYELWLTRKGKPVASCGTFNVQAADKTELRLSVAYRLKRFDGWVVTRVTDVRGDHKSDIVMTT